MRGNISQHPTQEVHIILLKYLWKLFLLLISNDIITTWVEQKSQVNFSSLNYNFKNSKISQAKKHLVLLLYEICSVLFCSVLRGLKQYVNI